MAVRKFLFGQDGKAQVAECGDSEVGGVMGDAELGVDEVV